LENVAESHIDVVVKCPECMSHELNEDIHRGELTCVQCGLVIDDDIIDKGAEWRMFDMSDNGGRGRVGPPTTMMIHDKGLATDIGWQNKDYSGKMIPVKSRSQMYRMRKWQQRARISNSNDRNLIVALAEIERMCSQLDISKSLREHAGLLYRKAVDNGVCRGRSIEGVSAACVYVSCRMQNVPRTLDEVSTSGRVGRKEIGRVARFIIRILKLRMTPSKSTDFTARFCSRLGLPPDVEAKANEMMNEITELELESGRGPVGMCASCIYIASVLLGNRRTQTEIGDVAGVTEVTIRNRYKEICVYLGIELEL